MSYREKIAMGECVSPLTTDRCPNCIDVCEAFSNKCELDDLLRVDCICENPLPFIGDTHICKNCKGNIKV